MADLENIVDAYVSEGKTGPGVVMLAVNQEGNAVYSQCSGHESLAKDAKPISPGSIFRLASCTKLITTVAILRFVSLGHASLDDSSIISQYLPELWEQQILTSHTTPFTSAPRKNPITLRMLLSHTSGSSLDMLEPLLSWRVSRSELPISTTGPSPKAYETPLLFEPGEGWAYGAGQDWAALLIERLTGQKFSKWCKENVCDVVGMDSSIGYWKDELEKCTGKRIVSAVEQSENGLREKEMPQLDGENAGGGLMCSVENFVKILQDLISKSPKLLPEEMMKELFAPQLEVGGSAHKALTASAPIFRSMTGPLSASLEPANLNHSLGGVLITVDSELGKTKGTMCWGGAYNWIWWVNRVTGVAGVFAAGMWPPGEENSRMLQEGFVKEAWGRMK